MISFLSVPGNLPDAGTVVEIRQTHGSVLALTDTHVYKVKKPIDFGFMDFSTLDKRQANSHREIKLNRRLCTDTYLDVLPISEDINGNWYIGNNNGKIIDYAVRMKRMEDGFFLKTLLECGENTMELMDVIGKKLINFYGNPNTSKASLEYGTISHIKSACEGNFEAMGQLPEKVVEPILLNTVKNFTYCFLNHFKSLILHRKNAGKILECHGDLHIDHMHYRNGRLCIFDCIEFSEAYRSIDIANDLAFFVMDLEYNGYIREAAHFSRVMSEGLNDPELCKIMHFYKTYRACVRGKIHGLMGTDTSIPAEERHEHLAIAKSYFQLALRYSCSGPNPTALIFIGPIGCGKSTLAAKFASLFGCKHINSDVIRKDFFDLPRHHPTPETLKTELYSEDTTARVYDTLIRKGLENMRRNSITILDATFSNSDRRGEARLAFLSAGVKPLFIYVYAKEDVIHKRLREREKNGNSISDARDKDYDKLVSAYPEPNPDNYQNNLIEFDNSDDLNSSVSRLLQLLTNKTLENLSN